PSFDASAGASDRAPGTSWDSARSFRASDASACWYVSSATRSNADSSPPPVASPSLASDFAAGFASDRAAGSASDLAAGFSFGFADFASGFALAEVWTGSADAGRGRSSVIGASALYRSPRISLSKRTSDESSRSNARGASTAPSSGSAFARDVDAEA